MTSTSPLTTRLNTLIDARKTTNVLINRLSKLPCQPGIDNNDVRAELSAEIHALLKEQEEELDLLRQEVDDLIVGRGDREKEADKARLEVGVQRLGEDLRLARRHFRKAQLQAKRNAEVARQKERELLFAGVQQNQNQQNGDGAAPPTRFGRKGQRGGVGAAAGVSQDELEANASGDVTAALRRTHQLLQSELSRSQFAHDTLQQSTEALQTLSESYSGLSTLLASSRSLVSTLLRSQKSDTWYLETAFYILVGTIVWLVFRRFVYGPFWWFVWLPLKLLVRGSWALSAALGSFVVGKGSTTTIPAAAPERESLIVQSPATGAFPKWEMGEDERPSVVVGGGGKSGSGQLEEKEEVRGADSMVEQVGKMVDDAQREQGVEGSHPGGADHQTEQTTEQQPEQARNPKKRMWEEDKEAKKYEEQRSKDEL
ncbi:MAG: hypothetical protein M1816_002066 [Peltula sp. TS41687]|nr:MAG: hypothetical protein M1816_002066 [Peltula sp. TS41687]